MAKYIKIYIIITIVIIYIRNTCHRFLFFYLNRKLF
jgi:hypothetical protein